MNHADLAATAGIRTTLFHSRHGRPHHAYVLEIAGTIFVFAAQQILDTFGLDITRIHPNRGSIFMRHNRIASVFISSFLVVSAGLSAAPAAAQTPYDGLWSVTVVTKSGSCEPSSRSTLTVMDGKISAPGADVTGSVGREGLVRVSIHGAYANGQLSGNAGSGKWNGASAGVPCSGRWGASRQ